MFAKHGGQENQVTSQSNPHDISHDSKGEKRQVNAKSATYTYGVCVYGRRNKRCEAKWNVTLCCYLEKKYNIGSVQESLLIHKINMLLQTFPVSLSFVLVLIH